MSARERGGKTYMTDKQRRGERERRERSSHLARRSVAAQQSNIAAKALIMSPDSAIPSLPLLRSPILPLACELDPRQAWHHCTRRAGEQASHFSLSLSLSPLDGVCTKKPLEDSLDIQSPTSQREGGYWRHLARTHPTIHTHTALSD